MLSVISRAPFLDDVLILAPLLHIKFIVRTSLPHQLLMAAHWCGKLKSRFATGGKADKKNACEVNRVMIRALQGLPVKTITPDRGKEFARHAEVTSVLQAPFYFPEPHQPWQRGTNENTNGLLREYFPKGQDLTDISEDHIQEVFDELNKRPRKCLGYRTPYEVFYKKKLHLT